MTTVLVRLLVPKPSAEGPPTTIELATVELARLPAAYEWIAYAGGEYRIVVVRHIVAGDVAAEVQVERLPEAVPPHGASRHTILEPPFGGSSIPSQSAAAKMLNVGKRTEQGAMVAAKIASLRMGSNQHAPCGAPSQSAAAAMLNVGKRTVQRPSVQQSRAGGRSLGGLP